MDTKEMRALCAESNAAAAAIAEVIPCTSDHPNVHPCGGCLERERRNAQYRKAHNTGFARKVVACLEEAADEIDALRAELQAARDALTNGGTP